MLPEHICRLALGSIKIEGVGLGIAWGLVFRDRFNDSILDLSANIA
jgi:hypothetical protein